MLHPVGLGGAIEEEQVDFSSNDPVPDILLSFPFLFHIFIFVSFSQTFRLINRVLALNYHDLLFTR